VTAAGGPAAEETAAPAAPLLPPPPEPLYGYLVTQAGIGNAHALTGRAVTSTDGGRTWS
jgi:hypothetical protein